MGTRRGPSKRAKVPMNGKRRPDGASQNGSRAGNPQESWRINNSPVTGVNRLIIFIQRPRYIHANDANAVLCRLFRITRCVAAVQQEGHIERPDLRFQGVNRALVRELLSFCAKIASGRSGDRESPALDGTRY